jgi:hypothetical protein
LLKVSPPLSLLYAFQAIMPRAPNLVANITLEERLDAETDR